MLRIALFSSPDSLFAWAVVRAALERSFTSGQVHTVDYNVGLDMCRAAVMIDPPDSALNMVRDLLELGGKVLILGRVGPRLGELLGLEPTGESLEPECCRVIPTPCLSFDATPAQIVYCCDHPLGRAATMSLRPLARYDFGDEWNNLGFGAIRCDRSPWAVACVVRECTAGPIAVLEDHRGTLTMYATVIDLPAGSALWINRAVGPVDSLEWRIIEIFFGEYRCDDLVCFPYVSETPMGFSSVASPGLDCDEAVGSAQLLFELYASNNIPLSLAVTVGSGLDDNDAVFLRRVTRSGGSVLSHSVNHLPNWGGSYPDAFREATVSKRILEELLHSDEVNYVASPFHQNPSYAVNALADAGYKGFVGGIIKNDPEFLLGRAGRVPFTRRPIISLSRQCMLHGDCFARYGDSIGPYEQCFRFHYEAGSMFAYLDHPFSERYQYGWASEGERIRVHEQLIEYVNSHDGVLWLSHSQCLDFLVKRDSVVLGIDNDGKTVFKCADSPSPFDVYARVQGRMLTPQ